MRSDRAINSYNYCETLVLEHLNLMPGLTEMDSDFMSDVICVALNRIKPRYMRERIYFFYHITDGEWVRINEEVRNAIDYAVRYIRNDRRVAGNRDRKIQEFQTNILIVSAI